nr:hypothetical protein [Methanobrevibacter arboriphilus]
MSKCELKYNGQNYEVAWIDFDQEQVCIKYKGQRKVVTPKELDEVIDFFLSIPLHKEVS